MIIGNAGLSPERESLYLDLFEEQRVRGVLVTPQTPERARVDVHRHEVRRAARDADSASVRLSLRIEPGNQFAQNGLRRLDLKREVDSLYAEKGNGGLAK